MTYVMSDLHGQYELYCETLEKIDLRKDDTSHFYTKNMACHHIFTACALKNIT